jgi:hypothetical protein
MPVRRIDDRITKVIYSTALYHLKELGFIIVDCDTFFGVFRFGLYPRPGEHVCLLHRELKDLEKRNGREPFSPSQLPGETGWGGGGIPKLDDAKNSVPFPIYFSLHSDL